MSAPHAGAALVAIGDELLEGRHPDLNSAVVAATLLELGVETHSMSVVRDDEDELAALFASLAARHVLVVASGGLGPTLDDVTRHAAARAAGLALVSHPDAERHLASWYARAGAALPAVNARQALVPAGAELLANSCGTAPGFLVAIGASVLACLPGPPVEMRAMLADELVPRLRERLALVACLAAGDFYLFGLTESQFAERVGAWMDRPANPLMGVSALDGVLRVRLSARAARPEVARALFDARARELRARLAEHLYSEDEPELGLTLGRRLIELRRSVSLAESCTGGLAAALLTRTPGISAVLSESYVTYSDEAKRRTLGVPPELLARHGAVSEEVALAMAAGAAERSGARLALAITGVAGPTGGSPEKPVGHVCFGLCVDGELASTTRRFPALERERIRRRAALAGLALLLERVRAPGAATPDPGRPR